MMQLFNLPWKRNCPGVKMVLTGTSKIITKGNPANTPGFSKGEIKNLSFHDFDINRKEWLNLKPAACIDKYF